MKRMTETRSILYEKISVYSSIRSIHLRSSTSDLTKIIQESSNYERIVATKNVFVEEEAGMTTDGSFWPERIDFLCCLSNADNYFERCIDYLMEFYQKSPSQLQQVDIFARTYRAEDVIHWYTKDSFVYRRLNIALRQYKIRVLVLFAFLIKDLRNQLQTKHDEQFLRIDKNENTPLIYIYRGQLQKENSISWLVNNTFLSMTFDRMMKKNYCLLSVLNFSKEKYSMI